MERHVNALGTQEKRRTASGENHIHHLSPAQLRGTGISVAQKELLPNCHVSQLVVPVVNYYEADLLFFLFFFCRSIEATTGSGGRSNNKMKNPYKRWQSQGQGHVKNGLRL